MVQASVVSPSSSVKRVFSETVKRINAKFCGKVAIHHISRPFLALRMTNFCSVTCLYQTLLPIVGICTHSPTFAQSEPLLDHFTTLTFQGQGYIYDLHTFDSLYMVSYWCLKDPNPYLVKE